MKLVEEDPPSERQFVCSWASVLPVLVPGPGAVLGGGWRGALIDVVVRRERWRTALS